MMEETAGESLFTQSLNATLPGIHTAGKSCDLLDVVFIGVSFHSHSRQFVHGWIRHSRSLGHQSTRFGQASFNNEEPKRSRSMRRFRQKTKRSTLTVVPKAPMKRFLPLRLTLWWNQLTFCVVLSANSRCHFLPLLWSIT